MTTRTALPLLLTLTLPSDTIEVAPLFKLRLRHRETGRRRPALEPCWGLW